MKQLISPGTVTCIPTLKARTDASLVEECRRILKTIYQNPDLPLEYALMHEGDRFYHVVNPATGRLAAFFVAQMPQSIRADLPLTGYLGLAAQEAGAGSAGLHLCKQYMADASQAHAGENITIWYRTATPFALYPCYNLLKNGEPWRDGAYSDGGRERIAAIRDFMQIPPAGEGHPFVARGVAKARYREEEVIRMRRFRDATKTRLFDALDVREENGDRVLMVGTLPSAGGEART